MLGLTFHHVGIACQDIDRATQFIKRSYIVKSDSGTIFDECQNAYVRIFNEGEPNALELVSGLAVAKIVEHQTSYYHVCYLAKDLDATLLSAKSCGAIPVSRPMPAILFGMRRVAFVFTPLGLVEFLEE